MTSATPYPTTWPCPVHEAADEFYLLEGPEFQGLVENIKAHGLRDPIVLTADGKILDGRNRFRACLAADVTPRFTTFRGPGKAIQYVISVNLHRRHLTTSQRSMIAAKLATMAQGTRTDLASNESMSQAEAAKELKVSRSNVQRAKTVREQGAPELAKAVVDGAIKLGAATEIATLPHDEQRKVVKQVKRGVKPSTIVPKEAPISPDIRRVTDFFNDICLRLTTEGVKLVNGGKRTTVRIDRAGLLPALLLCVREQREAPAAAPATSTTAATRAVLNQVQDVFNRALNAPLGTK